MARVDDERRYTSGSTRFATLAFVLFGIVIPLTVFGVIGHNVADKHRFGWDAGIANALDAPAPPTPLSGDTVASVAAYAAVAVGALVALLLVRKRRVRHAFFWTLAIGGSLALDPLLKSVFKRPSLDGSAGYSFPSGTAMLTMAAATAVVLLSRRRRLPLAAGGAAVVGADAAVIVHARWHYPSDVVAGWALGLAWVSSLWLVFAAPALGRHLTPADVRRGEAGRRAPSTLAGRLRARSGARGDLRDGQGVPREGYWS